MLGSLNLSLLRAAIDLKANYLESLQHLKFDQHNVLEQLRAMLVKHVIIS